MTTTTDLALSAFALTKTYIKADVDDIIIQLTEKHPNAASSDVYEAAMIAARLQDLVLLNPIYNEPFSTAADKAMEYLRVHIPGLSNALYFHAQSRIMQMYLY